MVRQHHGQRFRLFLDLPYGAPRRYDRNEAIECAPTLRVHIAYECARHIRVPVCLSAYARASPVRADIPACEHDDVSLLLTSVLSRVWVDVVETSGNKVGCGSHHHVHGAKSQNRVGGRGA